MSYQPLGQDDSLPFPVSRRSRLSSTFNNSSRATVIAAFFCTAIASYTIVQVILICVNLLPSQAPSATSCTLLRHSHEPDALNSYVRPGVGQFVVADEDEWSMERIREMVLSTKGYYARDWSLYLGWNNMRYIIEAGLMQAKLLNRTLILPSFVYARACEWDNAVCEAYAPMVNRGQAVNLTTWDQFPIEKQMAWRIPIEVMLDLRIVREYSPTITVKEYLLLHDLNPEIEVSTGAWGRELYHSGTPSPRLYVIPNQDFDPSEIALVDVIPAPVEQGIHEPSISDALFALNRTVLDYDQAKDAIRDIAKWEDDVQFDSILEQNGYVALHTFVSTLGMDFLKSVVEPIKEVVMRSSLRGWYNTYSNVTEEVLLLEGETHLGRKPGSLRFTTANARDDYAYMVTHSVLHLPQTGFLAERLARRMRDLNGGRMWMASHMRRGDFAPYGWMMELTLEDHFKRIKSRLQHGAELLRHFRKDNVEMETAPLPFVTPDRSFDDAEPPMDGDKFFLATDERSPEGLEYIRSHGAILITDLLLPEDRRLVGWPLLLTDVLAEVEQHLMAQAAFFYATALSSQAGGAVNSRGAKGFDPRTTVID